MQFIKYSSNGNDFLIFHTNVRDDSSRSALALQVCDRHNGIGADGMVALIPVSGKEYAYEWDFYNADGSRANMCGNASRSVGHYAYVENLAPLKHSFLSAAGIIGIEIDTNNPNLVQSDLGTFSILQENITESNPYGVESWKLINTGVPHLVGLCENLPQKKDSTLAHLREKFDANITLAKIARNREAVDKTHKDSLQTISYATFERGVEDITLACGTGAAAAFVSVFGSGLCGKKANLIPPSKDILELCLNEDSHILLKGEVRRIARCGWLG